VPWYQFCIRGRTKRVWNSKIQGVLFKLGKGKNGGVWKFSSTGREGRASFSYRKKKRQKGSTLSRGTNWTRTFKGKVSEGRGRRCKTEENTRGRGEWVKSYAEMNEHKRPMKHSGRI